MWHIWWANILILLYESMWMDFIHCAPRAKIRRTPTTQPWITSPLFPLLYYFASEDLILSPEAQNSVFHHDKSKKACYLICDCACCVRPHLRRPPLWFALAQEALLYGFAVFYQTIPSHRGADLPLLGITLFSAGISFIIRVLSVSPWEAIRRNCRGNRQP